MFSVIPSHKEDVIVRLLYHINYERNKLVEAAEKLLVGKSTEVVFHGMRGVFKTEDIEKEISFKYWKGTFRFEAEGINVKITRVV